MEIHVFHHIIYEGGVTSKIDQVLTLVQQLVTQGVAQMNELDVLKQKVQDTLGAEQSAIELVKALSEQIKAGAGDKAAMLDLAAQLDAKAVELGQAVAAAPPTA